MRTCILCDSSERIRDWGDQYTPVCDFCWFILRSARLEALAGRKARDAQKRGVSA